jgi:flavorubredoxin/flavin reductase (DIM6/NTAB) family NADH-FMN oxidoreductase RutF
MDVHVDQRHPQSLRFSDFPHLLLEVHLVHVVEGQTKHCSMHGQCQRIGLVGRHVHTPFDAHAIQRRLSLLPRVKTVDNGVINHSKATPRVVVKCSNREEASAQAVQEVQEVQEQAKKEVQLDVSLETLRVSPSVTLLRASCAQRPPEIQFGQALGTTTNCYLVSSTPSLTSQTEFTLIDLPSKLYAYDIATWLEELGALQGLTAVMLTRFGPDRIPALKQLLSRLQKSQKITVFASNPAFQLLKDRAASDLELAQLLDGHDLSRGGEAGSLAGHSFLQLIPIPTPRWPDLCAIYYPEENILFSSSFFSAHISASHISTSQGNASTAFDDEEGGPFWEKYVAAWRFYFDCMMSPTPKQTAAAFEKLRINPVNGTVNNNSVSIICPLHGPVVRSSLSHLVSEYSNWIRDAVDTTSLASVVVLYASAYGNTAALAQALSRGITKAGVGVEMLNLEVVGVDEVERALDRNVSNGVAGFVIGSPTLGGHMPTQVQSALGAILRMSDARALPCGVFGSYGWSGEAVDEIEKRLKDGGFKFGFPTIRCKFSPTEAMLQLCEESGTDLAQAIKRNMRKREKTVATNLSVSESESVPGGVLALGRVVGTLCVLTAKLGERNKNMDDKDDEAPIVSGMLASWVSQASFAPPGLTVAVKKDRAVESMLPVGSRFVLNVLPDSNEGKQITKSMLKPFSPGEDRFQGLDVIQSEATGGCFILQHAASYLECTVAQRMEAGDHWIVYAIVNGGEVLNDGVDSAVHHRVSGARY